MMKQSSPSSQASKTVALHARTRKRAVKSAGTEVPSIVDEAALLTDLREPIQSARQRIATVANSTTTLLYWHLAACRALGWARVGPARGGRLGAKRSRVAHPASICNNACAPLQAQPEGPWRFAAPCVVAGSLCGLATRRRRRLAWHRDSPRRGPNPKSDRLLAKRQAWRQLAGPWRCIHHALARDFARAVYPREPRPAWYLPVPR